MFLYKCGLQLYEPFADSCIPLICHGLAMASSSGVIVGLWDAPPAVVHHKVSHGIVKHLLKLTRYGDEDDGRTQGPLSISTAMRVCKVSEGVLRTVVETEKDNRGACRIIACRQGNRRMLNCSQPLNRRDRRLAADAADAAIEDVNDEDTVVVPAIADALMALPASAPDLPAVAPPLPPPPIPALSPDHYQAWLHGALDEDEIAAAAKSWADRQSPAVPIIGSRPKRRRIL
jgi:hypothetical protein